MSLTRFSLIAILFVFVRSDDPLGAEDEGAGLLSSLQRGASKVAAAGEFLRLEVLGVRKEFDQPEAEPSQLSAAISLFNDAIASALSMLYARVAPALRVYSAIAAGPEELCVTLCAAFILFSFFAGIQTGWWSWVDRIWSLSPALYALSFAAFSGVSPRALLMAGVATAWAARLTWNFARKGGFGAVTPENEDYRWPVLRRWFAAVLPPALLGPALHIFHAGFVCVYQNVLLYLLVVPACAAARAADPRGALTHWDGGVAAAFALLLAGEVAADEQQWAFQQRKHAMTERERAAAGGDFARGFLTTGVFSYTRHLNFFCEQGLWVVFYCFSVVAEARGDVASAARSAGALLLLRPAALGPALLILLFQGSTWMTELISLEK
jgi:steroid 5-alpha reductase family enzyme